MTTVQSKTGSGAGYPYGLAGKDIPMAGRIVAVVDVFDALTHDRPYKGAWPVQEALQEIERQTTPSSTLG
jgi:putative two-component system response regulator